eukprot:gene9780-2106_t
MWIQHNVKVKAPKRGHHLITNEIEKQISKDLSKIKVGLAHLFIQHTSAGLTINENCDRDVRLDMEDALNFIAPEDQDYYRHTTEGSDDMPAHVKSTLVGSSISIPITNGKLNLGTWQGIWLCEFRDYCSTRTIIVTLQGE